MFLSSTSRAWCETAGSAQGGCILTAGIANRIQLEGWMVAAEQLGGTLYDRPFSPQRAKATP
jgi:hypothetical protein